MKLIRSALDWLGWERVSETRARHNELIKLITDNHKKVMATIKERLEAIETHLTEGLGEVTTEITTLREQLSNAGQLPADAEATLQRIEAKASALKDIIPNAPPVENPPPAEEPAS